MEQDIEGRTTVLPHLNDIVAGLLEDIADGSKDYHFVSHWANGGICCRLDRLAEDMPNMGKFDAYEFVASVSNRYEPFERLDKAYMHRWRGVAGEFRRQWCRDVARELRLGTIVAVGRA